MDCLRGWCNCPFLIRCIPLGKKIIIKIEKLCECWVALKQMIKAHMVAVVRPVIVGAAKKL